MMERIRETGARDEGGRLGECVAGGQEVGG